MEDLTFKDTVRMARETLGDATRAMSWLDAPCKGLGGRRPLDIMRTPEGRREVVDLLGRLDHGVIS